MEVVLIRTGEACGRGKSGGGRDVGGLRAMRLCSRCVLCVRGAGVGFADLYGNRRRGF
jgi:hypothetical protein